MIAFEQFFEASWKSKAFQNPEPFPWQSMLAERGVLGEWPEAIELPTASGKTACLDVAVFALACQASLPIEQRTAARRIWFVVDRRIVVDEAFRRACKLATKLQEAHVGVLREVADKLRSLSGTDRPLAVARLRGGVLRDDGWAHLPSQPAVICSTVDQLGSRLLFRGYGHSDLTAAIYAGLAVHDSLILLDEAHCAVPFMQTLRAVARFRGDSWAEQPLRTPFRFTILSATPPSDIPEAARFPCPHERAQALGHPVLQRRLSASKPAQLAEAEIPTKKKTREGPFIGPPLTSDELALDAAQRAIDFVSHQDKQRVAVMVNRVATAEIIARQLRQDFADHADVVLLTGRMRPIEREYLIDLWEPHLRANDPVAPERPIIVTATQCLEVGADFSFDALVTECASLDALRQRFGRLDRLGTCAVSPAAILIRASDARRKEPDPIYGTALAATWKWLTQQASVDFGVNALTLPTSREQLENLLAPTDDAPVLLPTHLDFLCQTAPRPDPEPDVSLFLHGKQGSEPEIRVLWRADLTPPPDYLQLYRVKQTWLDTLALLPPASIETLGVPISRLRRWLVDAAGDDRTADVGRVGEAADDADGSSGRTSRIAFLLWRGRDGERSILSFEPREIRPGDTVVLPASAGMEGLGQRGHLTGLGEDTLDLAELAIRNARGRAVLRLQPALWRPWADLPAIAALLKLTRLIDWERDAVHEVVQQMAASPLPPWVAPLIRDLGSDYRIEQHPAGGLILFGRRGLPTDAQERDPLADADDLSSAYDESVTLTRHTVDVMAAVCESTLRCLPAAARKAFEPAAKCHDLGKLDPRFQQLLHNGDAVAESSDPLAKSARLPLTATRRRQIRLDAGLPEGFRHELLSAQLAEQFSLLGDVEETTRDLALQLIASHHGHARPFAPIAPDPNPPAVNLFAAGIEVALSSRERASLSAPHHLASGVAGRFWRLTRRYGWWGLAYLEAIFRLADWQASRRPREGLQPHEASVRALGRRKPSPLRPARLALDALDGANPLAYLAALGTLRLLTNAFPEVEIRLGWESRMAAWRPVIEASHALKLDAIVEPLLANGLRLEMMFTGDLLRASEVASPKNKKGEPSWKDKLRFPAATYRDFCLAAVQTASQGERAMADYATTWASEVSVELEEDCVLARRTRFDFTAGQQAFVAMLRQLKEGARDKKGRVISEACGVAHLRRALTDGWQYSDKAVSMRWDPQDEKRQYALQGVDPTNRSKNPPLADPGANFLAVEALPLFPFMPDRPGRQPGFARDADGRHWQWVIWERPVGLDVVRSLVGSKMPLRSELQRSFGIVAIFQSAIVQPSGRYRCFTPARSLW